MSARSAVPVEMAPWGWVGVEKACRRAPCVRKEETC